MTNKIEKSLLDIDFGSLTRREFTPWPAAREDQTLYFLLLDRFSDGNECGGHRDSEGRPVNSGTTPLYTPENPERIDYDRLGPSPSSDLKPWQPRAAHS